MMGRVLVVDDDADMCRLLAAGLERRGFDVEWMTSATDALEALDASDVDAVLADVAMPEVDGLELCERITANRPDVPVTLLTGLGSLETAVAAIRAGAYDFLLKPPDLEVVVPAVARAVRHGRTLDELRRLRPAPTEPPDPSEMIGESAAMRTLGDLLARVGDADANVLITGESGSGKEMVARALHRRSRRQGPFVPVNCAAVPETLLESELFGHVRGAFTDARTDRLGLFARAHGGTLFLDEIVELPLPLQPKLLRALQERAVRPVGSDVELPCDVRVITATNRDPERAVAEGRLREDLYFRIDVVHVAVPPLRARGDDVLHLARHFLARTAAQAGKRILGFAPAVAERLLEYRWPGNVRELENTIERAVVLARYDSIGVDDLPERLRGYQRASGAPDAAAEQGSLGSLDEVERRHIRRVLDAVGGNRTRAARVLGVHRKTLARKLRRG